MMDDRRVTTLELFFDLVFVFAFTQLSADMARMHSAIGMLRGTLVLALIWWSWSAYSWLGNHAPADVGAMRIGLIVAMTAMFVMALAIPEAWRDLRGGLRGPLVLAVAYVVVRAVHMALYAASAGADAGLRRQLAINLVPLLAGIVLLVAGALVGRTGRTALWSAALAVDWLGVYVTSQGGGGWRLSSVGHWVERHGLVVLLALGESVAAIGTGAAGRAMGWGLVGAAVLGILVAAALWWLYFDSCEADAERIMSRADRAGQVRAAIEAYTYEFFLLILGIVVIAVGVREVVTHVGAGRALGAFGAGALCGGSALYVSGLALFWWTLSRAVQPERLIAAAALLVAWPLAAALRPMAALALLLALLAALIVVELARAPRASGATASRHRP